MAAKAPAMRFSAWTLSALTLGGCRDKPAAETIRSAAPSIVATASSASDSAVAPRVSAIASGAAPPSDCPQDMVLVAGNFCPTVEHECIKHTKEYEIDQERRKKAKDQGIELPMSRVSERCLRYKEPATCLAKARVSMRFCIDRYEWPNQRGAIPALAVTWVQAKEQCERFGKRLCDVAEFDFACEGEDMLPYSYGFVRDDQRCNIDKPYVTPSVKATPYEECIKFPSCKRQLEAVDQRVPSGSMPECKSPFGVFDINGNVNEWVNRPGKESPWRSGLKGGWWGPARSRCRPTVTAHNEIYAGYEVGFRCCKDATPSK
jgi:hypothetical protein